jgi:hypothetical protein
MMAPRCAYGAIGYFLDQPVLDENVDAIEEFGAARIEQATSAEQCGGCGSHVALRQERKVSGHCLFATGFDQGGGGTRDFLVQFGQDPARAKSEEQVVGSVDSEGGAFDE